MWRSSREGQDLEGLQVQEDNLKTGEERRGEEGRRGEGRSLALQKVKGTEQKEQSHWR